MGKKHLKNRHSLELSSLLDVIFILLLFVMVSIQFNEPVQRVALDLPEFKKEPVGKDFVGIQISRTGGGDWFLDGSYLKEGDLFLKLRSGILQREKRIFLELDPKSDLGGYFRLTEVLSEFPGLQLELVSKLK